MKIWNLIGAFAMFPALANVDAIISPIATCDDNKCVMSKKDYETLRAFHAERLQVLQQAGEIVDSLQAQNTELAAKLNRLAFNCRGRA